MADPRRDPRQIAEARVGETLRGKWTLDRLLDVGGMAAVYAATHRNGKRVAVKLLHQHVSAHKEIRERFLREGYVANKVDHPGAVSVLDDDTTDDGAVYLVMELLEGESLDAWLTRVGGRLRAAEVLALADQVLEVLEAAHAKGIVHRDIKPANLFATKEGRIKILDFGLARLRDPGIPATASGIVMGTAAYMPPEQATGKSDRIDGRSDLFAVGAVMFRALTGKFVHDAPSPQERLMAAMRTRAPSLATVLPEAPKELVDVVDRALEFDINARWPDAARMRMAARGAFAALKERWRALAQQAIKEEKEAASSEFVSVDSGDELSSIVVSVSFGD